MRALITGGAGFIGSHLCEYLLSQGHEVMVLDDLSTGSYENIEHLPLISCIVDSTLNQEIVRDLVREADVVFHLAATVGVQLVVSQPIDTIVNNIRGTETVLEETCRYRRPLLIASTSEVYGKGANEVFNEDDDRIMGATSLSRWGYAASKAIDEFLALAYWHEKRLPVSIARLFNIVGPRQTGRYGMVIPRFVRQALRDQPITVFGDGQQTRCFTYVADILPTLVELVQRSEVRGEVYNVGSSQCVTIESLAKLVLERTGSSSEIEFVPYEEAYGPGYEDMRHRAPDITKITKAVGYAPTTSLADMLDVIIADARSRLTSKASI
jgi:UDP-glucose 4-epimerase